MYNVASYYVLYLVQTRIAASQFNVFILLAKKVPILIFTGTSRGEMIKWERLQLNPFMYRYDTQPLSIVTS